jgi:outer membrane protein assembly factor BamA
MTRFVLGLAILVACTSAFAQSTKTVTVRNLTLINLTQVPVEDYQQIVQFALNDKNRAVSFSPELIPARVLDALQQRGYFRSEVGDPEITVVSEGPTEKVIDVAVRVKTGPVYKLRMLILAGNRAFRADELRAQLPIKPGEVFNTEKLRVGLDNLLKFYVDEGYINFVPCHDIEVFEDTTEIGLKITFKEGARFYFGGLNLSRLPLNAEAAQTIAADWSSLKGQPYSDTELRDFTKQHSEVLPNGFLPEQNLEIRQDLKTHTVAVEVVP